MNVWVRENFLGRMETTFPGAPLTYERLTDAVFESVAPGKPESYLFEEVKTIKPGSVDVWPLREQLSRRYRLYHSLCKKTQKHPAITEQTIVGIYLRYLPSSLGLQVGEMAATRIWTRDTLRPSSQRRARMGRIFYPCLRTRMDSQPRPGL